MAMHPMFVATLVLLHYSEVLFNSDRKYTEMRLVPPQARASRADFFLPLI